MKIAVFHFWLKVHFKTCVLKLISVKCLYVCILLGCMREDTCTGELLFRSSPVQPFDECQCFQFYLHTIAIHYFTSFYMFENETMHVSPRRLRLWQKYLFHIFRSNKYRSVRVSIIWVEQLLFGSSIIWLEQLLFGSNIIWLEQLSFGSSKYHLLEQVSFGSSIIWLE